MSVSRFDEALAYNPEFAKLPEELRESIINHIRLLYSKEYALLQDLESRPDIEITGCHFEGENMDGSQVIEFEKRDSGADRIKSFRMNGWHCCGPSGGNMIERLQQRLTVAEQLLSQVEGACDLAISAIDADDRGANFVKIIQAIKDKAALNLAEAGEGS